MGDIARASVAKAASLLGFIILIPSNILIVKFAQADSGNWVDEAKLGVLAHDYGVLGHHVEGGADVNGEILFSTPDFLKILWAPRPTLGGSVNTAGNTDYAYAGLTWNLILADRVWGQQDKTYVNIDFGGAVQDGYLDTAPPGRKALGTRFLFHGSFEIGYQITPIYSVSAYLDHASNAGLGGRNPGLNELGFRTGFKF